MKINALHKYRGKDEFSYSFGSFPTFELLKGRADAAALVLLHPNLNEETAAALKTACVEKDVPYSVNTRMTEKLRDKENCMAIGVFMKYKCILQSGQNHVVLVNPGDAGNVGTIIRSCAGFGIRDLAVIEPAVDVFHPKVIRASMGAIFGIRFQRFAGFEEYAEKYGAEREMYPFMLNGRHTLGAFGHPAGKPYALIFGNEAAGLDDRFLNLGKSVVIAHNDSIDSLNIALAAGIGIYEFSKQEKGMDTD